MNATPLSLIINYPSVLGTAFGLGLWCIGLWRRSNELTKTARAKTLSVGNGINDAPAMMAATVGTAIDQNTDVTAESAGVVVTDNSLRKMDEFMHLSRRMRIIALPGAVGGMALSIIGRVRTATGQLMPVAGAITREVIDALAVLNALPAAFPPKVIHDL